MRTLCLTFAILSLLSPLANAVSGRDTGTSTITFSNITGGGTCNMEVDSPIQIGAGDIDPLPAIGADWVGLAITSFDVNLESCSGLGDSGLTPKITVRGSTLTGRNDSLFSTGTNNTGFGVIIYDTKSPTTPGTISIVPNSGTIPIPGHDTGILSGNVPVSLKAAVGCGATADCAATKLRPGNFSATITFDFAYQ
ncbi:P pilus assembly protein, pilin FimA [Serratia proteamaculans]|uniref:fimbrial protein n=1 Tax=Serratia proteamaculans TaxID=28151 RepID=UPI00218265B0|nr:fimbrial protein [Serratia proteamaculans]CAI2536445.1 P pilus assembly protein, pilin FimA [Serratia proteamaculans]